MKLLRKGQVPVRCESLLLHVGCSGLPQYPCCVTGCSPRSRGSRSPVAVEGGREGSLESWRKKGFVSSGGAYPHIYDLNLYGAHRGSKCLLYRCVHSPPLRL